MPTSVRDSKSNRARRATDVIGMTRVPSLSGPACRRAPRRSGRPRPSSPFIVAKAHEGCSRPGNPLARMRCRTHRARALPGLLAAFDCLRRLAVGCKPSQLAPAALFAAILAPARPRRRGRRGRLHHLRIALGRRSRLQLTARSLFDSCHSKPPAIDANPRAAFAARRCGRYLDGEMAPACGRWPQL